MLVGHFGSGKTEVALNLALELSARGEPVTMADLDVVKPYFRTRSAKALLSSLGIELLAPEGETLHADLPAIVPQIRSHLRGSDRRLIIDVGGDDVGARVLGSLSDVVPRNDTDCLLVLNFRRPSTPNPDSAAAMVREIEAVGRLPVTGLIANTHIMDETTLDVIRDGLAQALETGQRLQIPVVAVAAAAAIAERVRAITDRPVIALRRIVVPPFDAPRLRTNGPLFVLN